MPNAFRVAQEQVLKQQKKNADMKTTVVCMATDENKIYVEHIGDSRFYGFKKDGTHIRTLDHSVSQLLVQSNIIKETEIRNHPNRNMLLKAIGDKSDEQLCELMKTQFVSDFEAFLLCSDGFWELINEDDMVATLKSSETPQEWLNKMTDIVEINGNDRKMDNDTAIAVCV